MFTKVLSVNWLLMARGKVHSTYPCWMSFPEWVYNVFINKLKSTIRKINHHSHWLPSPSVARRVRFSTIPELFPSCVLLPYQAGPPSSSFFLPRALQVLLQVLSDMFAELLHGRAHKGTGPPTHTAAPGSPELSQACGMAFTLEKEEISTCKDSIQGLLGVNTGQPASLEPRAKRCFSVTWVRNAVLFQ